MLEREAVQQSGEFKRSVVFTMQVTDYSERQNYMESDESLKLDPLRIWRTGANRWRVLDSAPLPTKSRNPQFLVFTRRSLFQLLQSKNLANAASILQNPPCCLRMLLLRSGIKRRSIIEPGSQQLSEVHYSHDNYEIFDSPAGPVEPGRTTLYHLRWF